jgi:hypothetical protein
MSGNEYLLAFPSPTLMTCTLETYQANIKFINKTLSRAQITYSSLIVCLWYIDQFFARRRRQRLQQQQQQRHMDDCLYSTSNKAKGSKRQSPKSWHVRDLFMASIIVADKYM